MRTCNEKNGKEYRLSDLIMELDKFPELKELDIPPHIRLI